MSEIDDLARKASARAALSAGKNAARKAIEDLTLSDEERAARDEAEAKAAKARRWKYLAIGIVGLCLLIGIVGMLASLWKYFLGLALLAALGFYVYWRLRPLLASRKVRVAEQVERKRVADESKQLEADRQAQAVAAERAAIAAERAAIAKEQAIEDELAALKAKAKK
ncbi:MAG: hypothetical protein JNL79_07000 [Myxococcales bacterium]|nr:hypothetical protein [Myxococcales bacterium]